MNLDELRKIAENATPGPWESTNGSHILGSRGASVAQVWGVNWRNNQTFIETFNPELIVSLLDRVEKSEGELDLMEQTLDLSKMVEDKVKKKLDWAEQALQRVRERHQKDYTALNHPICNTCGTPYPCPTIKTLEGY